MTTRGVPARARWTPVPDVFFSRDLPALADPVAIKVVLHLLWRIQRRATGEPPALAIEALATDTTLVRGILTLGVPESALAERIATAVDTLVAAGLLLEARVAGTAAPERWLLLNTPEGRAARGRLMAGRQSLPRAADVAPAGAAPERLTIYALYEDNIGLLTPMLAEELKSAEADYPDVWIERAFRLAVTNNARKWAYVRAILERWAREGVDDEGHRRSVETARERDSEGPYAAYIER